MQLHTLQTCSCMCSCTLFWSCWQGTICFTNHNLPWNCQALAKGFSFSRVEFEVICWRKQTTSKAPVIFGYYAAALLVITTGWGAAAGLRQPSTSTFLESGFISAGNLGSLLQVRTRSSLTVLRAWTNPVRQNTLGATASAFTSFTSTLCGSSKRTLRKKSCFQKCFSPD